MGSSDGADTPLPVRVGIVTVSDRASRGEYEDRGGPAVRSLLERWLESSWEPVARTVTDDRDKIEAVLRELSDGLRAGLIITTGGTGPAARDVTPEATLAVCSRILPGFGERMRSTSADRVPTALLSRQTAGIRGSSLIINLPGSPRGIEECLRAVFPAVPHCLELIGAPSLRTHPNELRAFDPGHG